MDIKKLKEYIYENERIVDILEDIGCKYVRNHSNQYYTCANRDGDNKQAITVYNNETLTVVNYTRQMVKSNRGTDLLDLISFNKDISFIQTLKYVSDFLGLEYYHDFNEDIPESIKLTKFLLELNSGISNEEEEKPLKKKDIHILDYYKNYVNDLFYNDNISYETQQLFQIGYDEQTNRITIPIFSEVGDLVGVKGRLFKEKLNENDLKYIYLESTPRYAILYGLNMTYENIVNERVVYVVESEKAVMQLWSYGYKNAVATGGKKITNKQIQMLSRLDVEIVLCFDKDVKIEEVKQICSNFDLVDKVSYVYDNIDLLNEKESPTDDPFKWESLLEKCKYVYKEVEMNE